jgi:pimeloyl-ACP methyl ester carboxylesterase
MRSTVVFAFLVAVLLLVVVATPTGATPTDNWPLVVYIGGLNSNSMSAVQNFAPLEMTAVRHNVREVLFSYGGSPAAYTNYRSCQPIEQSTLELANFIREQPNLLAGVILVGHSNGGVVAFELPAAAPDLTPFIRRVITIDSPLGGITWLQRFGFDLGDTPDVCPAADQLRQRRSNPAWPDYLARLTAWEEDNGIDVLAVANLEDLAVTIAQQELPAKVNIELQAYDDGLNHSALLHSPDTISQIADLIWP